MMFSLKSRTELIQFAMILAVACLRFYGLSGGLVLGEPDEFIHQSVVENLRNSPWPSYGGIPWFFQIPLYPYLGFVFSFIFGQRYVALRFISVLSSVLLVLSTYLFFRYKISARAGFFVSFFLSLSPFSIYISRLALLDSSFVAFGFLFIYALELALEKKSKFWAGLAGIFLSLSLMVKYSALIYVLVALVFFLIRFFWDNLPRLTKIGHFRVNLVAFFPLLVVGLMTLPVLFLMRKYDPYYFKLQLYTSLGFIRDFWRIKGGELSFFNYLSNLSWWLTLPVSILFPLGLVSFIKSFRKFPILFLSLLITLIVVLPFRPFYPRYFYPLVPLVVILAGVFWEKIWARAKNWQRWVFLVLFLGFTLPTSWEAWASTRHNLIENAGQAVQNYRLSKPWVFSNYWPNVVAQATGSLRTTWLTQSVWDGRAFVADLKDSPVDIFKKESGFVLLEELYASSRYFINPSERLAAWRQVEQNFPPVKVIVDNSPNFPHFKGQKNQVRIYFNRIQSPQLRESELHPQGRLPEFSRSDSPG